MERSFTYVLLLCLVVSPFSLAKTRESVFDWVRANDQSAQVAPRGIHEGRTYYPGPDGGSIHVDIRARQPVTVAMVSSEDWNAALSGQQPDRNLDFRCLREHVVSTSYTCVLPGRPMTLIIRDERKPGLAMVREVDTKASDTGTRGLRTPNDLLIIYYRWDCIRYCEPTLRWSRLSKQKYEITPSSKPYRIVDANRDGRQISVRIKSPIPLAAVLIPAKEASQPDWNTDLLQINSTCSQIEERNAIFKCNLNPADGPMALLLVPAKRLNVPVHTKASVELDVAKCISNCNLLSGHQ